MPDMETVLASFGIDMSIIDALPTQDYDKWEQEILYDFGDFPTPFSISQRIKSMGRQATKRNYI